MDILSDFHAFWGVNVPANSSVTVRVPPGVTAILTNAALHVSCDCAEEGPVSLSANVNGAGDVLLFPFKASSYESTQCDLIFAEGDSVVFTAAGKLGVDLCGSLVGGFSLVVQ